ncbi:hypothetical protein P171DRAFT_478058 [Karstenula rhodostoma CBS 690.94]|uniref:F-box domain-containing protein n=1 Tax=Karstenula rhodostoma CBS 690.94 TaxID=1392251 RepID=A0A9P4U560_9PLEO|nr:hypothetical protein P171DRAFT_478058 [Karstenula rhodostoma CBS 690.94]
MATSDAKYRGLPEEMLELIVSFADIKTLIQLSITSKILHRIVEPHLYSSVTLSSEDETLAALRQFAWTITNVSHIAAQVRTLYICAARGPINKRYLALARRVPTQLPHLQSLHVQDNVSPDSKLKYRFWEQGGGAWLVLHSLRASQGSPHPWRHLTQLDADFHNTHLGQLFPILQLPALDHLHMRNVAECPMLTGLVPLAGLRCRVKYLRLTDWLRDVYPVRSYMNSDLLHLGACCQDLESFAYITEYHDCPAWYIRNLLRVLEKPLVRGILRTLVIHDSRTDWDKSFQATRYGESSEIGNLRFRSKVRDLDVDVVSLFEPTAPHNWAFDITLPDTLQNLRLRSAHSGKTYRMVMEHLRELHEQGMVRVQFPVLKSITIFSTWPLDPDQCKASIYPDRSEAFDDYKMLRAWYHGIGVTLEVCQSDI